MQLTHLTIVAAIIFSSCGNTSKLNVNQGIEGKVVFSAGNRMPSPDVVAPKPKGIKTTLFIYELTNINQVDRQGNTSFYNAINTKLVSEVQSNANGSFKINLLPGQYSLFVKKDTLFYANWFDENNNIAPVKVVADKMTNVEFNVDYDATY